MLIQIHGGGFANRGAQLMLWTVIDRISARFPDVRFCAEQAGSDFQERASYDLYTIAPRAPYASLWKSNLLFRFGSTLSKLLPKAEMERYGIVRRADIDALVDISGYAFGDKWPIKKSASMAARVSSFRRQGKPVVLFPQMFGPFERPKVVQAFQPVVEKSSLIYARDKPSFACLEKINATGRTIGLAPDITIFTPPITETEKPEGRYACLVPNSKMLDQGKGAWDTIYVERMAEAAERLLARGVTPRVLIHDANAGDQEVGQAILDRLGRSDEAMLIEEDPRRIKGIIGGATVLVGSRFHAIVASLSTGTPAIAMGWAHKYEALMEDFGVSEYMHRHDEPATVLHGLIDQLTDEGKNAEIAGRLAEKKQAMKPDNEAMWDRVFDTLGASQG